MRRSKLTETQIAFMLRQAEEGTAVADVCRKAMRGMTPFMLNQVRRPSNERHFCQTKPRRSLARRCRRDETIIPTLTIIDSTQRETAAR